MLVGKSFEFHAAHRLLGHEGKCRNIHGHTYRVEVTVNGSLNAFDGSSSEGMVLDFARLKDWWKPLDAMLDHVIILHEEDPVVEALEALEGEAAVKITLVPFRPTAENLAQWLKDNLSDWLVSWEERVVVDSVRVYETPTSWAEL